MKYHVTEYYLATGMEGIPYQKDYGIFEAASKKEAMYKANKTRPNFNEEEWNKLSDSHKYFAMSAKELGDLL